MRKVFIMAAVTVVTVVGFTSCAKCEICTKENAPETRICEGDYNTTTEWGAQLDVLEAQGYNCR